MRIKPHHILRYLFCGCLLLLLACQKDKDILDRYLRPVIPNLLTTVISHYPGSISRDSIFWYQDASGRVDSAYRFDSAIGRRVKVLAIDRSTPGMILMDDGDIRQMSASILFNAKNQPYKVIFFDRMTSMRLKNSYNFTYGNMMSADGLESYVDSIYYSATLEGYNLMSPGYKYPVDEFARVAYSMGSPISGEYCFNTQRGDDLSAYSFVPFVSLVLTSNLANRQPGAIHKTVFDTYIWGEVMRPWLYPHLILGFEAEQFYPMSSLPISYQYSAQVRPKQIIYSDGRMTISNYYP